MRKIVLRFKCEKIKKIYFRKKKNEMRKNPQFCWFRLWNFFFCLISLNKSLFSWIKRFDFFDEKNKVRENKKRFFSWRAFEDFLFQEEEREILWNRQLKQCWWKKTYWKYFMMKDEKNFFSARVLKKFPHKKFREKNEKKSFSNFSIIQNPRMKEKFFKIQTSKIFFPDFFF